MSVLRCCSRALQCGRDGSVSEVHEEKILCPKGTASALALLCWRRGVIRLGRCPGCSSVVGRQRKPRSALCVCVCATPTATGLHHAKNVFVSCLPAVAPANHLFCLVFNVISPSPCCFSSLFGSDMALLFWPSFSPLSLLD